MDGDGAAEGGEGEAGGGADAACCTSNQSEMIGKIFGQHD